MSGGACRLGGLGADAGRQSGDYQP